MSIGSALLVPAFSQHYSAGLPEDPITRLKRRLGSALKHFWLPEAGLVTIGFGGGSTLDIVTDNVSSGAVNMVRAAGTTAWHTSGGPGDRPYCELASTSALMRADSLGYANGHTISLYAVIRYAHLDLTPLSVRTASNTTCYQLSPISGVNQWRTSVFYSDNSYDEGLAASPAPDLNWHLFHLRALIGGGIRGYLDGQLLSPNAVMTKAAKDLAGIHWGYVVSGNSGGGCAATLLVDAVTADRDDAVREFVASHYGMAA